MTKAEGSVITVGVTGASGAVYARAVLPRFLEADARVARVFFVAGRRFMRLLATELGVVASDAKQLLLSHCWRVGEQDRIPSEQGYRRCASPPAALCVDGMAVVPCSAGALASIAAGTADDLLTRASDVCLKERRPLVLCLRETPLNRVHLENMLRVHDAGAVVMPAMPAFYYGPKTIDEIVEQFAYRVLAQLGLPQEKQYHWQGGSPAKHKT